MNIADRKLRFVQEFIRITDEEIIGKLEQLLSSKRKKKISKEFVPMTMEKFNKRIDQSEDDFKNGRFTEIEHVLKSIDTWE